MGKIGIYYGSDTGNTQEVAEEIAKQLGVDKGNVYDVAKANTDYSAYDVVLFGCPTLSIGELQDDWVDYLEKVKDADLNGKTVALFGCGDAASYSDTFGDALGIIYDEIKDKGIKLIGETSTDGYEFDDSRGLRDGKFLGLLIDNDNEPEKTDDRITAWVKQLKSEM